MNDLHILPARDFPGPEFFCAIGSVLRCEGISPWAMQCSALREMTDCQKVNCPQGQEKPPWGAAPCGCLAMTGKFDRLCAETDASLHKNRCHLLAIRFGHSSPRVAACHAPVRIMGYLFPNFAPYSYILWASTWSMLIRELMITSTSSSSSCTPSRSHSRS